MKKLFLLGILTFALTITHGQVLPSGTYYIQSMSDFNALTIMDNANSIVTQKFNGRVGQQFYIEYDQKMKAYWITHVSSNRALLSKSRFLQTTPAKGDYFQIKRVENGNFQIIHKGFRCNNPRNSGLISLLNRSDIKSGEDELRTYFKLIPKAKGIRGTGTVSVNLKSKGKACKSCEIRLFENVHSSRLTYIVTANKDGNYTVDVPVGEYKIEVYVGSESSMDGKTIKKSKVDGFGIGREIFAKCSSSNITVSKGRTTRVRCN